MVIEISVAALLFGCGFVCAFVGLGVGFVMGRMTQNERVGLGEVFNVDTRSDRYPEIEEVMDDDYFEKATLYPEEGGLPFPSDAELAAINRHSNEGI